MDKEYFETKIWPHMSYMSYNDIWRWKMNVARVMGNSRDRNYTGELIRAFTENSDDRVRGMAAWALGNIGGEDAETESMSGLIPLTPLLLLERDSGISATGHQ